VTVPRSDPMLIIAESMNDILSECGYAFVEDDKIEALADTVRSFLKTAGIPVDPVTAARNLAARPAYTSPTE
jgi:hypothetical protein